MRIGTINNSKTESFAMSCKLPFCDCRAYELPDCWACFSIPGIDLFILSSHICWCHPNELNFFTYCSVLPFSYMVGSTTWLAREAQYLYFLRACRRTTLNARSDKPFKRMLVFPLREHTPTWSWDAIDDTVVTVYLFPTEYEEARRQHTTFPEPMCSERFWFNAVIAGIA